jgi:PhzF family phenazine biosynthesis protein
MAQWGIAYAAGPNYNKQWVAFDPTDLKSSLNLACTATKQALKLVGLASPVEQALIRPLAKRYPLNEPGNVTPIWNDDYATLGTCHAWLAAGGQPRGELIVQECGLGLIQVRRDEGRLAFAAPKLIRSGAPDEALLVQIAAGLRIDRGSILDAEWVDNGPGWVAIELGSRAEVLALDPDFAALDGLEIGVIGAWDPTRDGPDAQFEVRAFAVGDGVYEDPVTGSLNAGLAQWLIGGGRAPDSYVASQGPVLGRAGRVHVDRIGDDIWIGGNTKTNIKGVLSFQP